MREIKVFLLASRQHNGERGWMMAVDVTITKAQMIRLLENYREERESISQILRHLSQDIEGFYQPSSQGSIDEAGVSD